MRSTLTMLYTVLYHWITRAIVWMLIAVMLFLIAVALANIVRGEEDQWNAFVPREQPRDEIWMPAFRKWLDEQKANPQPMPWDIPCVCSCADTATWDKCCAEGPVAQSGEPPPCKRATPGRNRPGPPSP